MSTMPLAPLSSERAQAADVLRCCCGRLLGRVIDGVAHTKCQRCKREVALDFATDELRCLCRRLLARRTERGVELKCPRCKATAIVPGERS